MSRERKVLRRARERLTRVLVRNLFYKIAALLLALGVWAWVQSERVVEQTVPATLEVEVSEGLALIDLRRSRVRLTVSGPQAYVKELRREPPVLTLDLTGFVVGTHEIDVLESALFDLPAGVEAVQVDPPVLDLTIDEQVTRSVELRAAQVGRVAEGHRVVAIRLDPDRLELVGPASAFDALGEGLSTEGIDVDGLTESVEREVEVPIKKPGLDAPEGNRVRATIEIEAITGTRVFTDVPVLLRRAPGWVPADPELTLEVTLKGPLKVIEGIPDDALTALVRIPEDARREPISVGSDPRDAARFEITDLPEGVSVESTRPARLALEPRR